MKTDLGLPSVVADNGDPDEETIQEWVETESAHMLSHLSNGLRPPKLRRPQAPAWLHCIYVVGHIETHLEQLNKH